MQSILQTTRLQLREFHPSDAQQMYDLNADEEVIRYTGDPPFESVASARAFLLAYDDYERNGYGRWAVIRKRDQEYLGWCGLKFNEEGFTDLGFRFFKKYWNQGYATESARACLAYGFQTLELEEIIGRVARANVASIRVLEKLNMTFWKEDTCKGIADSLYYRIRKPAWGS